MMIKQFIELCIQNEISFSVGNEGELKVNSSPGALTKEIIEQLKQRKQEIIAWLQHKQSFNDPELLKNTIPLNCDMITPKMLPLIALTQDEIDEVLLKIPGGAGNIQDIYPLAPLQEGVLFIHTLNEQSDPYILTSLFEIADDAALDSFKQGLNFIIQRHDVLRTAILWRGRDIPLQVVQRQVNLPVETLIFDEQADVYREMNRLSELDEQWIDLENAPLLRIKVAKVTDSSRYLVLVQFHHLVVDHASLEIIFHELMQYNAQTTDLLQSAPSYREFIADTLFQTKQSDADNYFALMLGDFATPTYPFGLSNVAGAGIKLNELSLALPQDICSKIRTLSRQQKSSPAVIFHAAWAMVLSACSNEKDVVFGTVMSGRMHGARRDSMVGMFINTLPIRVDLNGLAARELLSDIKNNLFSLVAYEQTSLVQAQRCSSLNSNVPLFSAILNYRHSMPEVAQQGDLPFEFIAGQERTNYPFALSVNDLGEGFELDFQIDTSVSVSRIADYMLEALNQLLQALESQEQNLVAELSVLPQRECDQQLIEWNDTAADYPKDKCIHELFEAQVQASPDAVAVVFEGEQLTYGELNQQANQLACYLIEERQVTPDTLVGICVERSLEMIVGIMGILKAGGAYVPLDPDYPEARLTYMLEDAKLSTVLTQERLAGQTPVTAAQAVYLDSQVMQDKLARYEAKNVVVNGLTSGHLAYVIYTSGSTGNPKGVMVEHQNVRRLFDASSVYFSFDKTDVWTMFHSFAFDFSVWEIFGALLHGGKLVVVPKLIAQSADEFCQLLRSEQVTVLNQTPSAFNQLARVDITKRSKLNLRYVIFGGEALNYNALTPWVNKYGCEQPQLINMYGITETTVHVTYRRILTGDLQSGAEISNIGLPLQDLNALVLSSQNKLLPAGVPGELHVGGAGLTRGYLNRPELTAEKFIANPFNDTANTNGGDRLYKTGDLVRRLHDGNLEYLGRIDHQVKIRGFRIELGEIEHELISHDEVNDAVVVALSDEAGNKRLVAYITHAKAQEMQSSDEGLLALRLDFIDVLKVSLGQNLPDYMVPSAFVVLEQLPLTPNGKIDRKALPAPDMSLQQKSYVAPTTATEKLLCEIWQEVLGVEQVGITDNFFALGGHSLLVMSMIAKIQGAGLSLAAKDIFATPQLCGLASILDKTGKHGVAVFTAPENVIPASCQHIIPAMLPLVSLTQENIHHIAAQVPGGMENIQDIYPLGPLQEGILFTHMMSDKSDPYVLPTLFEVKDVGGVDAFMAGIEFILSRHDALRTAILWEGLSQPVQVVCRQVELPVTWLEFDEGADIEREMVTRSLPENQWMDVTQAPLLSVKLARVDAKRCFLLLQYHHIISDHVGLEIIQHELSAYKAGTFDDLLPAAPYRNFIAHTLEQTSKTDAQAYFGELLGDIDEPTAPFGLIDTQGDGSRIVELKQALPVEVASKVRALCKTLAISPASLFHSAFGLLLSACSGKCDVVFGSVMSGRLQGVLGVETLLGVCINTLPVRLNIDDVSALDFVLNTEKSLRALVPFEQVSLSLAESCSGLASNTPLFSAMFNYRHSVALDDDIQSFDDSLVMLSGQERTNYPFNLSVDDFGVGFGLDFQLDSSVDVERVMSYMQTAIVQLVDCLSACPDKSIQGLSILPPEEVHQQLVRWNDTAADYPKDKCIHELFEAQVQASPDAVAVVFEGEQLTYGELNQQANQLACYLIEERQVTPDTLVGICVERSLEMIVGIMGILKAGGAYVPLDPDYPEARLTYMLEDAKLSTVLTQERLAGQTPVTAAQAVYLDSQVMQDKLARYEAKNVVVNGLTSGHLAYVIYTSGSTGNPKGVMVEHQNVRRLFDASSVYFSFDKTDVWTMFHSFAFDFSVWEIFGALLHGGKLVVVPKLIAQSADEFCQLLRSEQVTVLNQTPSAFNQLARVDITKRSKLNLRYVIFGGEALNYNALTPWVNKYGCEQPQLINMYGITETTVHVTYRRILTGDLQSGAEISNIGLPLQDLNALVLSSQNKLLPAGVPGELHVGGAGLTRGYLNRPELTAEKFIANPFNDTANTNGGDRLYKTGDLVRRLHDGNLEYLGRIDHQVKIRGFRIELGEIEHELISHDEVNDAVVVALSDEAGNKRLVAYITHAKAQEMQSSDEGLLALRLDFIDVLKVSLGQNLPDYMVPSAFVVLEQLPLTPNGKIDRKALPAPDMSLQQKSYVAPTTATEKLLCEIWQEVLGVEQVGITDNFFALGGHSLLATKLISIINTRLTIQCPLKLLFSHSVLSDLALAISELSSTLVHPPLTIVSREQDLLASYAQQRLWLLDKIEGGSSHYNMPGALRLTGDLNITALTRALNTVIGRHESLRTTFIDGGDGQPLQVIRPAALFEVAVTDLSLLPGAERDADLAELVATEASKSFDLSADLMLRAQLIKVEAQAHILLVTMHHIASDGWSMAILINEFSALYQAYVQGQENPLPELEIQYADYAHWQRDWLQGEVLDEQLGYWKTQLAALPVVHSLPLDKTRPKTQTFNGATHQSVISLSDSDKLNTLCRDVGGTLFMGLHAAFSVLLSRYSNETDIVVGSPIANREQAEVANLIGFFVNTLVLRSDLSNNPSFTELLNQSKTTLLDAYAHQQVPFEKIVETLQPERSLAHSPLFQVMLVLQNNAEGELDLPGLTLSSVEQSGDIAKYDLTLNVMEMSEGLQLSWNYNTDLFEAETIERLAKHFELLLTGLVYSPQESAFAIDMLPAEEVHQQLVEWNDTAAGYPKDKCIHQLFEEQVAKTPDNTALIFEDKKLTYHKLNEKSNQLAHYLIEQHQIRPDTRIGICVDRSFEMLIGIFAILKAGGAYVPLDPSYPKGRLEYMLQDASVGVVLTQSHLGIDLFSAEISTIYLDGFSGQSNEVTQSFSRYSSINPDKQAQDLNADNLAYVIYTSGSTGKPKGVMIEHASVTNCMLSLQSRYQISESEIAINLSNYIFDASVEQLFIMLTKGGALLIPNKQDIYSEHKISQLIVSHNITHVDSTPSHLLTLSAIGRLPSLKRVISGGEPITAKLIEAYKDKLINVYGPSETTVNSIITEQGCDLSSYKLIGRPIANTSLYILNNQLNLLPIGVTGELYIGGAGLARGYLNRKQLTADSFIDNPYYDATKTCSSKRLYKTGDLAHYLANGQIEFIGRVDQQVKVRGFRIELGEIEHQLRQIVSVESALVQLMASASGENQLLAYMKPVSIGKQLTNEMDQQTFISEIKAKLSESLPDYMVPTVFVVIKDWPLTANGKLDKKALPEPDASSLLSDYVAPETSTEQTLVDIWSELLNIEADKISTTASFFDLGGHSLLATKLVTRMNRQFDITLFIKDLFEYQQLDLLSKLVDNEVIIKGLIVNQDDAEDVSELEFEI